jgi:hypothetical protein
MFGEELNNAVIPNDLSEFRWGWISLIYTVDIGVLPEKEIYSFQTASQASSLKWC